MNLELSKKLYSFLRQFFSLKVFIRVADAGVREGICASEGRISGGWAVNHL